MKKTLARFIVIALVAVQAAGCGLILYPDREGQAKSGRIDPTVAILDGVGCLFFLIPGLIAFAVDFHEGTIYLPPGQTAGSDWRTVALPAGAISAETIEQAIQAQTGTQVSLADPQLQAWRLESRADLPSAATP
jgi:hypothetical protein